MTSGVNNGPIRKAQPTDIDALKTIADAHKKELGFIRRPTLLASIEREEVFVAQPQGGEIIGFVEYHHRRDEQTTLYNIVVTTPHQQQGYGKKLVQALVEEAQACDKRFIQLKCPTDLASNQFYESLRFYRHATDEGKRRPLNIWRKDLASAG